MEQKIKYLLDDLGIEDTNGEIIDDVIISYMKMEDMKF